MSNLIFPLKLSYGDKSDLKIECVKREISNNRYFFVRNDFVLPWTPIIYIVTDPVKITEIRQISDEILERNGYARISRITSFCKINRIYRNHDTLFWNKTHGTFLYTLELDSLKSKRFLWNFLETNAEYKSNLYGLPILQNKNIHLDAMLRTRLRFIGNIRSEEMTFTMSTWCTYDLKCGNYLRSLTKDELLENSLIENLFTHMPVLSYDIETVAKNNAVLPRGIEYDQALSSLAVTVHSQNISSSLILIYVPGIDDDKNVKNVIRKIQEKYSSSVKTLFFNDEQTLLRVFAMYMADNSIVSQFLNCKNKIIGSKIMSILIGYNTFEYDFLFIVTRLFFFGLYEEASYIMSLENRFSPMQISFDLFKHVKQRHQVYGSLSLDNVSRFFGAQKRLILANDELEKKMNFDSVSIRRLYIFDDDTRKISFNYNYAIDEECPFNLFKVIDYNIQDCICVFYLNQNVSLTDNVHLYSREFYVDHNIAAHGGNSSLLPQSLFQQTVKHFDILIEVACIDYFIKNNDEFLEKNKSLPNESKQVKKDNNSLNFMKDLLSIEQNSYDEKNILKIGEKNYLGGLNHARPGHYDNVVHLDFKSFYPSIACQFQLSFETVRMIPVSVLCDFRKSLGCEKFDEALKYEIIRIFDYEPPDSKYVKRLYQIKAKNNIVELTLRHNNGWYEGIEFQNFQDVVESSIDIKERRILMIKNYNGKSVISTLWEFYMNERSKYKLMAAKEQDQFRANYLKSMELMYKRLGNSLYGYLNYKYSICFFPNVAASITLLARKTFHETVALLELQEKSLVVYKDTDGLIVRNNELEGKELAKKITKSLNLTNIVLEFEQHSRLCLVMGMKKYWTVDDKWKFLSKGFERNASFIMKRLISMIQHNVVRFVTRKNYTKVFIRDLQSFFFSFFYKVHKMHQAELHDDWFIFNLTLTPRKTRGAEAEFIDYILEKFEYDVGDKVRCIFLLDKENNCEKTIFGLYSDFDCKFQKINYYKFFRRMFMYFMQIIEGCKRTDLPKENKYHLRSCVINEIIVKSYKDWLMHQKKNFSSINYDHLFLEEQVADSEEYYKMYDYEK